MNKSSQGCLKSFLKRGFTRPRLENYAEASGMSMGQFYHYVSSKDDVLYLLHKHMINLWRKSLRASKVEDIADPVQRLTVAIRRSVDFIAKNEKLFRFVFTESKNLDREHLRTILKLDQEHFITFWRGLLEEVNKREPIKGDIEILTNQIVFLQLFQPLRGWTVKSRSTEEIRDTMVDFILRGIGLPEC